MLGGLGRRCLRQVRHLQGNLKLIKSKKIIDTFNEACQPRGYRREKNPGDCVLLVISTLTMWLVITTVCLAILTIALVICIDILAENSVWLDDVSSITHNRDVATAGGEVGEEGWQ